MSEYLYVERPFLDHLRSLDWEVIDQGAHAIPSDPEASLRDDFREVTLRRVFCETVRGIGCPAAVARQRLPGSGCPAAVETDA